MVLLNLLCAILLLAGVTISMAVAQVLADHYTPDGESLLTYAGVTCLGLSQQHLISLFSLHVVSIRDYCAQARMLILYIHIGVHLDLRCVFSIHLS